MKTNIVTSLFNIKKLYFSISYFVILIIDVLIKTNLDPFPFRYLSKTLLIVFLIVFYVKNHKTESKLKHYYMLAGLLLYLLADLMVINHMDTTNLLVSMVFFILAKFMYCLRFSNNRDFEIVRLLPFLLFSFILMVSVFLLIYDNLGSFLIPVLIYFFISLLYSLFAFLRKNDVNTKSYYFVLIGMFFILTSEVLIGLKLYYKFTQFDGAFGMLSYGLAQFLIIYGITIEVKLIDNE